MSRDLPDGGVVVAPPGRVTIEGVDVIVWEDDLTVREELIAVAGPVVAWT